MIPVMIHEGVTDRRDRGLKKPWGSMGRRAIVLHEPEQLRGLLSPHLQGWANKEGGMSKAPVCVGIDVSKAQLDLALRPGEGCSIPHDEAGLTTIVERLRPLSPTRIVLEATGGPGGGAHGRPGRCGMAGRRGQSPAGTGLRQGDRNTRQNRYP